MVFYHRSVAPLVLKMSKNKRKKEKEENQKEDGRGKKGNGREEARGESNQ